jgi:hypothetical protein
MHSLAVPLTTIHASGSKPAQFGNSSIARVIDFQSFSNGNIFEISAPPRNCSALVVRDPGTMRLRFEAILVHF